MNSFFSKYSIENEDIIIQHGDVLDKCRNLPEEQFKLVISSPPYNMGKEYEEKIDLEQYLTWQKEVITELVRLCAKEGSIVWQVGNYVKEGEIFPLDIYFYPIFKQLGMQLRNRIIWHFEHGLHASKRFSGRYETLLWFTKTDQYTFNLDNVRIPSKYPGKFHYKGNKKGQPSGNPLGKNPSDYWNIICNEWENGIIEIPNVKANHPEKTIHPCQFPVELIERCVLALTNENDWILDPFGGVGSTLIAALKHKRKGMIIDINENYLKLAKERVQALLEGSLKLRPLGKAIHQPSGNEKVSQIPKEWFKSEQDILL